MTMRGVDIAQALSQVIEQPIIQFASSAVALSHEGELWVFVDDPSVCSPQDLRSAAHIVDAPIPDTVSAVHYVLTEWMPSGPERVALGLGRSVSSVHFALRKLLDLPGTFDTSQEDSLHEALFTLRQLSVKPVRMVLEGADGNRHSDAAQELLELVQKRSGLGDGLLFIEAEAGKGKTILLASVAQAMRVNRRGKLPIYIPLRKLPLEAGVAWDSITQLAGVVGAGAERLLRAVKAGLVTPFLDGLDEVSGRYDKKLIHELLQTLTARLGSLESIVVLSGRRTEARHLDPAAWKIFSVGLPEVSSDDFKAYVGSILDGLILQSSHLSELPQEYDELMGNRPADDQVVRERDDIVDWILDVFSEITDEPSLFFVQGLAAIAVGRRAGNRAPLRFQNGKPYVPPIWDVCLSAAVFACVRETSKIDCVAAKEYSVKNQMHALQGLAAISSAPTLASAPTPNELVPSAFQVDPFKAPEVYVAITRQNAKHALLYATEAAGGYRPQFLNDWIRCSFIAQIFRSELPIGNFERDEALKLAASAARAKYTFEFLLPSALKKEAVRGEWLRAFEEAISEGRETASANLWTLRAAIGDERLGHRITNPLPLAEIADAKYTGMTIGSELGGSDYFLDGTTFIDSKFSGACLETVSMRGVVFSNCQISNLDLRECDGPITFEDCTLTNVTIRNVQSTTSPALTFDNCSFTGEAPLVIQDKPAYGADKYAEPAAFNGCSTDGAVNKLISGDWAGAEKTLIGVCKKEAIAISKPEACLRRALRAFFPSHIGAGAAPQARAYIRLSALGRGSMPPGSPGQEELQRIFESVGFSTGGRYDHLYGPWSSVAGASAAGVALRNELVEFLLDSTKQGPNVTRMLGKLQQHFRPN